MGGDVSVLDALLYPNAEQPADSEGGDEGGDGVGMRAHTDPGLLTLTLASRVPGLQLRETASGAWRDVEACCTPLNDLIVFGGEALQFGSNGRHVATTHRVRAADAPRVSTVFELRMHQSEVDVE